MRFPSFSRSSRARTDGGVVPSETPVSSRSQAQAKPRVRALVPFALGLGALGLGVFGLRAQNSAAPIVAVSRRALNNNGRIEGSAQQLNGENVGLNGGSYIGGDLLVPGNPKVKVNGTPLWKGQSNGGGSSLPSNYTVSVNAGATLGALITQSDAIALDNVPTPLAPTAKRTVSINNAQQLAGVGAWNTVRDLNLNSGNLDVAVPAGTYGNFNLSGGALVLGDDASAAPVVYNLQGLTVNGTARVKCAGPVIVNVRNNMNVSGILGSPENQSWLQLNISNGGLTLNGGAVLYGSLRAPNGAVNVNGTLWGSAQADRLSVNGGGAIKRATIAEPTPVPTPLPTATPVPTPTTAPTPVPTATPFATPTAAPLAKVSPVLECVETLGGGRYRAHFGSNVVASETQFIPVGDAPGNQNKLNPGPIDREQPTTFAPGRTVDSFQVDFDGTSLVWTLRGRTATASANSNGCPVPTPTPTISPTATPIPNRAPVAANDNYSVDEDGTLTTATPGVLSNDSDADGDNFESQLVAGPAHGTLELFLNGAFNYVPAADYNGADSFTYRANDGALNSNVATVNITVNPVNDAPIAARQELNVDEDSQIGFALTASDIDGDALTFDIVVAPRHGVISGTAPDLTYKPNLGFFGSDSLQFVASDGTLVSNRSAVVFTVAHVNHAPISFDDAYTTDEDTPLTIAAPGVLANDSADPGDTLSAILVSGPAHGTLSLQSDGSFGYTPNPDYNGTDSFRYQARDDFTPLLTGAPVTVTITVNPVNDAPVAGDVNAVNVDISGTLTGSLFATDVDDPGIALVYSLVGAPAHGAAIVNVNGTFSYRPTPGTNYAGTDSFTYRATDAGGLSSNIATVRLTVTSPVPIARDDEYSFVDSFPPFSGNVTFNDSGAGDLTPILVTPSSRGDVTLSSAGVFTYQPRASFTGNDSFTYRVRDANGRLSNVATVTIRIRHINRAPNASPDYYALSVSNSSGVLRVAAPGVLTNDSDPDIATYGNGFGDNLTVSLVSPPQLGTLNLRADGSFDYTLNAPLSTQSANDRFLYRVSDGQGGQNVAAVSIRILPSGNPPVAQNQTVLVRYSLSPPIVLSGSSPDGISISYELLSLPTQGTLTSSSGAPLIGRIFEPNGIFYRPLPAPGGATVARDTFLFRVRDDRGLVSESATVTLRLASVNTQPVAVDDTATTSGAEITIPVLANDFDADGDALRVYGADSSNLRAGATLRITPDGQSLIYNPGPNFDPGSQESFTYRMADGIGPLVTGRVTVRQVRPGSADGSIRVIDRGDFYFGYGVINTDASGQIANGTTTTAFNYPGAGAYVLRLRNTGQFSTDLILRGPAREPGTTAQTAHWSVRYFITNFGNSTRSEITDQVTGQNGYNTDLLGPNASRFMEVEVRPDATVPVGATLSTLFEVRDRNDNSARDVFGAVTTKTVVTPNG